MPLPTIFDKNVTDSIISRIEKLTPESKPLFGKMNVGQMLAHCNVTYRYVYEAEAFKAPSPFFKLILKLLVKKMVVNEVPYKPGGRTGPDFIITDERNFREEQSKLIGFIQRTQQLGASHFEGKESHSFGKLTAAEWNNMFYKHIDHHLRQFGV